VSETSTTTDEQGRTSVGRTLGPAVGLQTTLATSQGLAGSPVTFVHTATAGSVAGLAIVSGDGQRAEAGTQLPADLVVRLTDEQGNGVSDAAVTWVVSVGGGRVTPVNGTTDDAGRASTRWTLGATPGDNRVDAVVSGTGLVSFRATGTRAGPLPTTTTITNDSPDPSVAGTTFTVQFRVGADGGTPTGTVRVTVSGSTPSCTGTLENGSGSCALELNITGDRTLTAVYSGASGFAGSSDTEPHRVITPSPENRPPDADYNWHCDGLTCQFTDASEDRDGSISGWNWNFGGTGSSSLEDPSHTFPGPGEYQVTLTVTDNGGATDQSTAGVEVEAPPPQNQLPAAGFTYSCTDLHCEFADQSTDADGRIEGRSWTFGDGDGSDRRNPEHDYAAANTYTVTLTVTDDDGATGFASQQVTVNAPPPENHSPTAGSDLVTTPEDAAVTIAVLANDSDPDGDPLTPSIETQAQNGTAIVNGDGSITYTPANNFNGSDGFSYRVSDGRGGSSDPATVQITVSPVDDPPVATDDGSFVTTQDVPLTISAADLLANDSDPDGAPLSAVLATQPANGTVTFDGASFSYTPAPGYAGPDSFTYVANDGSSNSNPANVAIEVTASTPPPTE
jgi:PKD repeat protein